MTLFAFVLFVHVVLSSANDTLGPLRRVFDASQAMMTGRPGAKFPDNHYNTLLGCLSICPDLIKAQDSAWGGFVEYYAANRNVTGSDTWGMDPVPWHESYNNRDWGNYTGGSALQSMDYNISFPSIPIYEPCNFASNFAYYRVAPEICHRASTQSMTAASRQGFVESLTILGFGSAFFPWIGHALGRRLRRHNDPSGGVCRPSSRCRASGNRGQALDIARLVCHSTESVSNRYFQEAHRGPYEGAA